MRLATRFRGALEGPASALDGFDEADELISYRLQDALLGR